MCFFVFLLFLLVGYNLAHGQFSLSTNRAISCRVIIRLYGSTIYIMIQAAKGMLDHLTSQQIVFILTRINDMSTTYFIELLWESSYPNHSPHGRSRPRPPPPSPL